MEALARRSDKTLAHEADPHAGAVAALARSRALMDIRGRRFEIETILRDQPRSAVDAIAASRRRQDALVQRRDALVADQPGWKPSRRRAHAHELDSIDRRISESNARMGALERQEAKRQAFRAQHAQDFAEYEIVQQAELTKRLQIRIEAVIDPSDAITNVLGPRPTTQRERLDWDRAVESIAVYKEQTGWSPPTDASTVNELLGPRPAHGMDRLYYDSVTAAIDRAVVTPERDLGMELDIGQP